ncbi:TPA: hypothetical protein LS257_004227 [Serratia liquefaciens]|nr:hypothetical protein [Serratia liquefaciens]
MNNTEIAAFSRVAKIDNLLKGLLPHMTSNNIVNLQIVASGRIIDRLGQELHDAPLEMKRGPRCFSPNGSEWINVTTVTVAALSFLSVVLAAYISSNRKVRVVFNDGGPVKEIEAPNQEQLFKILHEIKRLEIGD